MNANLSVINASLMSGPPNNGFTKAMQEVFKGGYWPLNPGSKTFNTDLLNLTLTHKPSIVFLQIQAPNILDIDIIKEVAKHSFVIQFSGDIRVDSPPWHYVDIGREIHLSLFTNMKDVYGCRKLGITSEWLEIGYDPERYRSWENPLKAPAIVAHFNDYGMSGERGFFPLTGFRQQIVERLTYEFKDDFGVFGTFKGAKGNFNNDQIMESRNYCGAKIAINCSHFFCEKYSSDRLLRILGSGTACVSHYFPGINEMYEVGNHLHTFSSIDGMVTVCKSLLGNPQEIERIGKLGQQHVLNNYTFHHMATNIAKFYEKYKK